MAQRYEVETWVNPKAWNNPADAERAIEMILESKSDDEALWLRIVEECDSSRVRDFTSVMIYGFSDDLIEVESTDDSIDGEVYLSEDDQDTLVLQGPDGERMNVEIGFGTFVPDGWGIRVTMDAETPNWTLIPGRRPDRDDDPMLTVIVPVGTTCICRGEPVR